MSSTAVETPQESAPDRRPQASVLIWIGALLVLAGPLLYGVTIDSRFLHRTGLAAFVPMILGSLVAILGAWSSRKRWPAIVASGLVTLTLLFSVAWLVLTPLPAASAVPVAQQAPDFTLPDQDGKPVTLREVYAAGPALLVFYRGHW